MNDLVDFDTVHLELDNRNVFGKFGHVTGDTVAKPGAHSQDQIALGYAHIGSKRTVHAYHAKVRVIKIRYRAFAHECRYNRHAGSCHNLTDKLRRIGRNDAAAGHQYRLLCFFKRGNCLVDVRFIPGKICFVTPQMNFCRILKINFRTEHVRRNINKHRTRPPGRSNQERFFNDAGQILNLFYQIVMLGNRGCNTGDIRFLKRIPANGPGCHLCTENNQRNRIHVGRRDTCNHVAYTWSGRCEADAGTPCGTRISVCRVYSALLMSGQDVPGIFRLIHFIIQRQDHAAGIAEYHIYFFFF